MPTLSIFYGIVIQMFWADHAPPHFHARYAEFKATFGVDPIKRLTGELPLREERFVLYWAREHQSELIESWRLCQTNQAPLRIRPLP